MMRVDDEFRRDPLSFLDRAFSTADEAVWLPGGELCLGSASASRAVLSNANGFYEDHSDFFHTRRGIFGPRSLQVEIGRAALGKLSAYLRAHADELPEAIERALVPISEWPDAGNWLVYRYLAPALIGSDEPSRLRRMVDRIVERSVLAGARERRSWLGRTIFRRRAMRELVRAIDQLRAQDAGEPGHVLAAMVGTAGPEVPAEELAEVFLSFLFAVAGSVGFTLGWSLYLLGTHPRTEAPPAWVVRETLRLFPVAWLLGRRPAQPHVIAGIDVTSEDEVIVCPYAVHRNPRHWEDPHSFQPERWGRNHDPQAFIPFGWGPHKCVAAALSMRLVEDVLHVIGGNYRATLEAYERQPLIGAALAPPRFTLRLEPQRPRS